MPSGMPSPLESASVGSLPLRSSMALVTPSPSESSPPSITPLLFVSQFGNAVRMRNIVEFEMPVAVGVTASAGLARVEAELALDSRSGSRRRRVDEVDGLEGRAGELALTDGAGGRGDPACRRSVHGAFRSRAADVEHGERHAGLRRCRRAGASRLHGRATRLLADSGRGSAAGYAADSCAPQRAARSSSRRRAPAPTANPSNPRAARRARRGRAFRRRGQQRLCPRNAGRRARRAARCAPSWRKCCQCPTLSGIPFHGQCRQVVRGPLALLGEIELEGAVLDERSSMWRKGCKTAQFEP